MTRWQPDARGRLTLAALELYAGQGYDRTTVAEIAARAGLTERTFFRHFSDKREVLFAGGEQLEAAFVEALAAAPPAATPIEAVAAALDSAAGFFEGRHPFSSARQAVIDRHVELQERELLKMASLANALTEGLRRRGVPDALARLTAETGVTVFRVGFERWVRADRERDMRVLLRETLDELRAATAG